MSKTALAISNLGAGPWDVERRIAVAQSEHVVSGDPRVVLTARLGSCVCACIRDPLARIGGMSQFLLPAGECSEFESLAHGVNAVELLVNGLVKLGGRRERMQARLYGGARLLRGMSDAGARTAVFAERFLHAEGVAFLGGDLGGECARLLLFWPVRGRSRQLTVHASKPGAFDRRVFEAERKTHAHQPPWRGDGAVEWF